MSEGASPAGFSASLGNSVNEERSCARKPNNIVVNASRNRLARKPYAGNPHVRFEEGEGSSRTLSTLLPSVAVEGKVFFCFKPPVFSDIQLQNHSSTYEQKRSHHNGRGRPRRGSCRTGGYEHPGRP